jgi:hypothetical protein
MIDKNVYTGVPKCVEQLSSTVLSSHKISGKNV